MSTARLLDATCKNIAMLRRHRRHLPWLAGWLAASVLGAFLLGRAELTQLVIEVPAITLSLKEPLLETLSRKPTVVSDKPVSMENLNQDYGFVLYRKKFANGIKGTLELKNACDYTVVMVNGFETAKGGVAPILSSTAAHIFMGWFLVRCGVVGS